MKLIVLHLRISVKYYGEPLAFTDLAGEPPFGIASLGERIPAKSA